MALVLDCGSLLVDVQAKASQSFAIHWSRVLFNCPSTRRSGWQGWCQEGYTNINMTIPSPLTTRGTRTDTRKSPRIGIATLRQSNSSQWKTTICLQGKPWDAIGQPWDNRRKNHGKTIGNHGKPPYLIEKLGKP